MSVLLLPAASQQESVAGFGTLSRSRFEQSLVAQQDQGIYRKRAPRGNPGGKQPEHSHGENNPGQYQWVAGSRLGDDKRDYAAGEDAKEKSRC